MSTDQRRVLVGVLALQGAFSEHCQLLEQAFPLLQSQQKKQRQWTCEEIRTPVELARCDALIIPGGESTTMSLVAARSDLLEPLRQFVKVERKPTWGTCAGLILLSEAANRTKKGGQDLIGGLDVRVNRNHFGRQIESFETQLSLPFLGSVPSPNGQPHNSTSFRGVFIRAPVVEKLLSLKEGVQAEEATQPETIVAPSQTPRNDAAAQVLEAAVEVLGVLPGRSKGLPLPSTEEGDIVAVRQGNCFGTSFHPELTSDPRIHIWWLRQVEETLSRSGR